MVEHILITLAELREAEALEQWRQKHPTQTKWLKRMHWLRIKWTLGLKWLREQDATKRALAAFGRQRARAADAVLRFYLRCTRVVGIRPGYAWVEQMRVKEVRDLHMVSSLH